MQAVYRYNFIKIKSRDNYLTMLDTSNNPRYMCFANKMDAIHCITYLSKFRSEHGYFPSIDLSKPKNRHKIESLPSKKRETNEISKLFIIDTFDQDDLDEMCSKHKVDFFYVHSFAYTYTNNEMELLLSAQELNSNPDSYRFTKTLDDMYNN